MTRESGPTGGIWEKAVVRVSLLYDSIMRLAFLLLTLSLAISAAATEKEADPALAPLWAYDGSWQVMRKGAAAGTKPEILANQCSALGRFFTCSQTVNGSQSALLVFLVAAGANHFYTQNIMPDGRATGRDDLQIAGEVWTYTSRRDQNGKTTYFRTQNTFHGKNQIHFESSHSDNDRDWVVDSAGDEVRAGSRAGAKP